MKTNNIAKINGLEVSTKLLEKKSLELTKLATRLSVVVGLLESLSYQDKRDEFAISFFMKSGQFSKVAELLDDTRQEVQEISDDLCPDLEG